MKLFIASDIHGSAYWCKKLIEEYKKSGAQKLLLLGDILYHGPRNPLPEGYNPMEVVELLTPIKEDVVCVQGNCDSEVDQMVLPFPILNNYAFFTADNVNLCLSHGHREVPPIGENTVYLTGHTHVRVDERLPYRHLNPGSLSLPKDGKHSYIVFEDGEFSFVYLA